MQSLIFHLQLARMRLETVVSFIMGDTADFISRSVGRWPDLQIPNGFCRAGTNPMGFIFYEQNKLHFTFTHALRFNFQ